MASIIDMKPARQKDWLRSDINLVQAKVDAIRANEIKQKEPQLDISYTIESEQYGNKTGKRLFIPINIFHRSFTVRTTKENALKAFKPIMAISI